MNGADERSPEAEWKQVLLSFFGIDLLPDQFRRTPGKLPADYSDGFGWPDVAFSELAESPSYIIVAESGGRKHACSGQLFIYCIAYEI